MKNTTGRLCSLTVVVIAAASICAAQTGTVKPLRIAPEQIQRVEILCLPESILVRAALTPEGLEQVYQYKLEIRDLSQSAERAKLVPLLQSTSVVASGRVYDHRTAVLLFNKNGRRIASIYFGELGNVGTINGDSGEIKSGIYAWAKSLLKGVPQ